LFAHSARGCIGVHDKKHLFAGITGWTGCHGSSLCEERIQETEYRRQEKKGRMEDWNNGMMEKGRNNNCANTKNLSPSFVLSGFRNFLAF